MKKWIKYTLILLLGIIVGVLGFEMLNKENDTIIYKYLFIYPKKWLLFRQSRVAS